MTINGCDVSLRDQDMWSAIQVLEKNEDGTYKIKVKVYLDGKDGELIIPRFTIDYDGMKAFATQENPMIWSMEIKDE